jgi:hypothetical protein
MQILLTLLPCVMFADVLLAQQVLWVSLAPRLRAEHLPRTTLHSYVAKECTRVGREAGAILAIYPRC